MQVHLLLLTAGTYVFEYIVSTAAKTDLDATNDTFRIATIVDAETYARDNGTVGNALGINGTGNTGELGNIFDLKVPGRIDSVIFATNGVNSGSINVGDTTQVLIYQVVAGVPTGVAIASSDFYIYTAADTNTVVRQIAVNGATNLPAGAYFVATKEFEGTDNLGVICSDERFSFNKSFFRVDGGVWATLESINLLNTNFSTSASSGYLCYDYSNICYYRRRL